MGGAAGRGAATLAGLSGLIAVVVTGASMAAPPRALATFAGRNGLLATDFSCSYANDCPDGSEVGFVTAGGTGKGNVERGSCTDFSGGGTVGCSEAEPVWAPDGRRLAFTSGGKLAIHRVGQRGWRTLERVVGSAPAWSPDGTHLAYVRARHGSRGQVTDVWRVRSDGRGGRLLVRDAAAPTWSSTGRLAFERFRRNGSDVYTSAGDGADARRVIAGGSQPDWSPDGRRLLAIRHDRAEIFTAAGAHVRSVTRGGARHPVFSPDGRAVIYVEHAGASEAPDDIYLVHLVGHAHRRQVTFGDDPDWQPLLGPEPPVRRRPVAVRPFRLPGQAQPGGIARGFGGDMWFADARGGVGRITAHGTVTLFRRAVGRRPTFAIARGPDHAMWFTEPDAHRIGRITGTGRVTQFSRGIGRGSTPTAIALGPDGNLWFTEGGGVGRITPRGRVTHFGGIDGAPGALTSGPQRSLWTIAQDHDLNGRIYSISVLGRVVPRAVISLDFPGGIAAGADGNLWAPDVGNHVINRLRPSGELTAFDTGDDTAPGSELAPNAIAAGPGGDVWFLLEGGGRVGRITPAGKVRYFDEGLDPDGGDGSLAAGARGTLWITEPNAHTIARLTARAPTRRR